MKFFPTDLARIPIKTGAATITFLSAAMNLSNILPNTGTIALTTGDITTLDGSNKFDFKIVESETAGGTYTDLPTAMYIDHSFPFSIDDTTTVADTTYIVAFNTAALKPFFKVSLTATGSPVLDLNLLFEGFAMTAGKRTHTSG